MQHKTTKTLAAAVLALMLSTSAYAYAFEKPVLLQDQGSFFAGGTTVTTPGSFDFSNPLNPQGQTKPAGANPSRRPRLCFLPKTS